MRILAVIGSNKGHRSTSASIIRYMEQQFEPNGIHVSFHFALEIYRSDNKREAFPRELEGLTEKDLVMICAPGYVDSLPAPLVHLLEKVRDTIGHQGLTGKKLLAVIHSGYPEPQQRRPALEMCRCFADDMGMEWCGGLSFGGTSPIDGRPLGEAGPFGKRIRPVLERTAKKIADGELSGTDNLVLEDISTMPVPTWMVKPLMNFMTRRNAGKDKQDLLAKPYRAK